jgi:hypothetical protein
MLSIVVLVASLVLLATAVSGAQTVHQRLMEYRPDGSSNYHVTPVRLAKRTLYFLETEKKMSWQQTDKHTHTLTLKYYRVASRATCLADASLVVVCLGCAIFR